MCACVYAHVCMQVCVCVCMAVCMLVYVHVTLRQDLMHMEMCVEFMYCYVSDYRSARSLYLFSMD